MYEQKYIHNLEYNAEAGPAYLRFTTFLYKAIDKRCVQNASFKLSLAVCA